MKDTKHDRQRKWNKYHWTRELLLSAIEVHLKSIGLVNVYDPNSDFNDGSWEMMQESMGVNELNKLKERLKI